MSNVKTHAVLTEGPASNCLLATLILERISTYIIISSQAGGGEDPGLYILVCMKRILKSLQRYPLPYPTGIISPLPPQIFLPLPLCRVLTDPTG